MLASFFVDGFELIKFAWDKEIEDKIFTRWIPYQDRIGFEEFKDQLTQNSRVDTRSKEEILDSVKDILNGII